MAVIVPEATAVQTVLKVQSAATVPPPKTAPLTSTPVPGVKPTPLTVTAVPRGPLIGLKLMALVMLYGLDTAGAESALVET